MKMRRFLCVSAVGPDKRLVALWIFPPINQSGWHVTVHRRHMCCPNIDNERYALRATTAIYVY